MIDSIARRVLRAMAGMRPTPDVQKNREHKFIVVGAWPMSNVVMCSWPEQWAAFDAAAGYSMKFHGVEFVVYERRGSVEVSLRPDDSELGESVGEFDDEPEANRDDEPAART